MKLTLHFYILFVFVFFSNNSFSRLPGSFPDDTRLYITTNKEIYTPSETVCFQAFLVNAADPVSSSLFIDLYSCTGNKLVSKKLPLVNNTASGSFTLPRLDNDYYLLYCYTTDNNGKPILDFVKKVVVHENTLTSSDAVNKNFTADALLVEYYFEGGTFVNELSNNILIKTSTADGKPIPVFGKIVNDKKEVVSIFNTNEQGFINATIIPYKNEKCSLIIKDFNNNQKIIPLPVATTEGLTFKITASENNIHYITQLLAQSYETPLKYTMEVVKENDIVYQSDLKFDEGKSQLQEEILNTNLPGGYLTFRIRDVNRKIYTERLFYNNSNTQKTNFIQVTDSLTNKTCRIDLPDYISGKGCISVNAIEKDKPFLISSNEAAMSNSLHIPELNSNLNFNKFNDCLIAVIKNVTEVINKPNAEENSSLTLSGTIYSEPNKPVKNKKINLIIRDGKNKKTFLESTTDENGRIEIKDLLFFDTATVYYQLADKSAGKNNIKLVLEKVPNLYTAYESDKLKGFLCINKTAMQLSNSSGTLQSITDSSTDSKILKELIVKSTLVSPKTDKQLFEEKYISPQFNFSGMMSKEFDFISKPIDDVSNESVAEFIRSRLPGIKVDIHYEWSTVAIYNPNARNPFTGEAAPVQVYIDEREVDEYNIELMDLKIDDVSLIRFYSAGWRPRPGGPSGGTLIIYKKRGDEHAEKNVQGLPKLKFAGYDSDQSQIDQNSQPADYKTLFWKTNYTFDGNKTIYANLSSGTNNKTITLKIEGINNDGIPFTFIKTLNTE